LLLPVVVACTSADADGRQIAWREVPQPTVMPPAATPTPGSAGTGVPAFTSVTLTTDQLAQIQPNELGRIPILMYHGFTTNPDNLDDWTVTPDIFRDDLTWLWEHDFVVVSIGALIHNELAVPPGRHPVVLTFDDASSGQFRLLRDATGGFTPDPVTAVGVMEAFYAAHPDFGRGGFFGVLPYNCFHKDGEVSTCEERLTWLAEHGYEIGNHTWGHQELTDVSDDELMRQVGETKIWIDARVTGPANESGMLVLPFGAWPQSDAQIDLLKRGFIYDGQTVTLSGVLGVEGGLSVSPSSGAWTRWNIARFNTDRTTWGYWQEQIETGAVTLFTSDGNPGTVTIPDPIPADVADQFDPDWAGSYGMVLIRYDLPAPSGDGRRPGTAGARWIRPRDVTV
jgi:peptidoglycan/xylan/chitin deacetylase (PgdA/CDA1 family)